jgi:hypothetical protein
MIPIVFQETEHEKILFYYPASVSLSQQMSDIGLAEAFVNFSSTFSPNKPCHSVHTEKTRQVKRSRKQAHTQKKYLKSL